MMQAREYLSKLGDLSQTQIFAKIENIEVTSAHCSLIRLILLFVQVLMFKELNLFVCIYVFLLGFDPF